VIFPGFVKLFLIRSWDVIKVVDMLAEWLEGAERE